MFAVGGAFALAAQSSGRPVPPPKRTVPQTERPVPQTGRPLPPPQIAEKWAFGPTVTEVGATLQVIGTADAGTTNEALANSLESATYRAATELVRRQSARTSATPLNVSFETLRGYVKRVGKVEDTYTQAMARGYRGYTKLVVSQGLLDPVTIRYLALPAVKPSSNRAVGFLLLPGDVTLAASTAYRVQTVCPKPSDGNFNMFFVPMPSRGKDRRLRLDRIDVLEDGSTGGTKWAFEVLLNGSRVIRVAPTIFDDRVGRYRMPVGDSTLEVSLSNDAPTIELQVVGTRPQAGS